MEGVGRRERVPTKRLKSSDLRTTTSTSTSSGCGNEKPETGERALPSIDKKDIGSVVEMLDTARKLWQSVRIVDVIRGQVHVVPQRCAVLETDSWAMRWVSFKEGIFRSSATASSHSGTNGAAHDDDDGRPIRVRKPANIKHRPTGGSAVRAMSVRKKSGENGDIVKRKKRRRGYAAERARLLRKAGRLGDNVSGHGLGEDGSGVASNRRDWGMMHVDVVGRNRPPFSRTLLFHGSLQAGVRPSGKPSKSKGWVVKRWPDKSARRKVDLEVHEKIRANPSKYLVEIVDVHPLDGVLMEFCKEGDLQTLLTKSRRKYMPLRIVSSRFLEIMLGLQHLHKLRIVHADVSPQNVFLRSGENGGLECVLGDFGHSYILDLHTESRSSVANHCGQEFVAPEVESGSVSTLASDIYSAGRILSQMLGLSKQFKETFDKESRTLVRTLSNLVRIMCTQRPNGRPSSTAVVKILRNVITW